MGKREKNSLGILTMEKYYSIKKINKSDENGFIVRIKNKRLNVMVGDSERINSFCFVNSTGNLETKKNYTSREISRSLAYSVREDYLNWITLQAYIGGVF